MSQAAANSWPWVCETCGAAYAAFRVYARWGERYGQVREFMACNECGTDAPEFMACNECGTDAPAWAEPPRGGWLETWHTILRPVPESFDPKTNPYPTTQKTAKEKE